jgi:hypothetical protein
MATARAFSSMARRPTAASAEALYPGRALWQPRTLICGTARTGVVRSRPSSVEHRTGCTSGNFPMWGGHAVTRGLEQGAAHSGSLRRRHTEIRCRCSGIC